MEAHSFSFEDKSGECKHGGYCALHLRGEKKKKKIVVLHLRLFITVSFIFKISSSVKYGMKEEERQGTRR